MVKFLKKILRKKEVFLGKIWANAQTWPIDGGQEGQISTLKLFLLILTMQRTERSKPGPPCPTRFSSEKFTFLLPNIGSPDSILTLVNFYKLT